MGNKYNKTAKSTYYKSSKKEHMKTEYMIIPNPKYASGQECLSLTFSEEMIYDCHVRSKSAYYISVHQKFTNKQQCC